MTKSEKLAMQAIKNVAARNAAFNPGEIFSAKMELRTKCVDGGCHAKLVVSVIDSYDEATHTLSLIDVNMPAVSDADHNTFDAITGIKHLVLPGIIGRNDPLKSGPLFTRKHPFALVNGAWVMSKDTTKPAFDHYIEGEGWVPCNPADSGRITVRLMTEFKTVVGDVMDLTRPLRVRDSNAEGGWRTSDWYEQGTKLTSYGDTPVTVRRLSVIVTDGNVIKLERPPRLLVKAAVATLGESVE